VVLKHVYMCVYNYWYQSYLWEQELSRIFVEMRYFIYSVSQMKLNFKEYKELHGLAVYNYVS